MTTGMALNKRASIYQMKKFQESTDVLFYGRKYFPAVHQSKDEYSECKMSLKNLTLKRTSHPIKWAN
jgi:hypothetical protein